MYQIVVGIGLDGIEHYRQIAANLLQATARQEGYDGLRLRLGL